MGACALAAALTAAPAIASAQGMLRGALEPLPGADDDFAPYAMGSASDTAFDIPPAERLGNGPELLPPGAAPLRRRLPPEEDPYEQLGIRLGAFLVKPSVTLSGGYDTNPQGDNPPEGSAFARALARIDVESDWIRHAFRGRFDAGYKAYDRFPEENAPDFAADAALRLDVRNDLRVDAALRGAMNTDTRRDPDLVGVTSTDQNLRLGAGLSLVYKPNRVSFAPAIEAARADFGDPSLDDRDYSQYEVRLRTGYELSPALEPFVEVSGNERIYDEELNGANIQHDSRGYRIHAGARFEPGPIWLAEARIGYGRQEAEDPGIPELSGLVAEGTVIWRPSELTEVRLSGGRDFEATTIECCAVADAWFVRASFEHEFRSWLILRGEASYRDAFHASMDYTLVDIDAELELEYKFNRMLSALGRIAYEETDSSSNSEDRDAAIFEVGLRFQR